MLGIMAQIPTLDKASMLDEWRGGSTSPFTYQFLKRNFVFSRAAWKEGRWWTAVSHMFLHGDQEHLMSNALGLATAGYPVAKHFGVASCYSVFLGGGIFTAVSGLGQAYQELRKLVMPSQEDSSSWWPESFIRDTWNEKFAPTTASFLSNHVGRLGCSAGISALNGMNVMRLIDQIVVAILYPSSNLKFDPAAVLPLLSTIQYFSAEMNNVFYGNTSGIDHAGHLTGFGFGIGCYGLYRSFGYFSTKGNEDDAFKSR